MRRIGVYICHCGGNISDHVDVERVRRAAAGEPGVALAKTAVFACSDAAQQEMVHDIKEQRLDGLVVASCSPKLHLATFREVARRAGLNPYQYTQVNIREQCSWAHAGDREGATEKAVRLVRAGIARTALSAPLEPARIRTVPAVLVVGAGIAGLRAALGLADLGLAVFLVERSAEPGGWVARLGAMYPHDRHGRELAGLLVDEVRRRENITLFTGAELVGKAGNVGDFTVQVAVRGREPETITLRVGAVIVATGFDAYRPAPAEYGRGLPGVLTLSEFKAWLDDGPSLVYNGRPVKDIAYIYCVGSRQNTGRENANPYCSRYCCNAAIHAANLVFARNPGARQFHFYRDVRTYGRFETMYTQSLRLGSRFLRFSENEPPRVAPAGGGRLRVTARDLLTGGEEITVEADLVVLVTGMVPRENGRLVDLLKLPLGRDRFFNEIHPKLRPVETVADGVFICGACQGPKNAAESVASGLSAAAQAAAVLKKGYTEREPLIATVDPRRCAWCGACAAACPYGAIEPVRAEGKETARVNEAVCKGCGGCAPLCPADAIDLRGYTDAQIRAAIDAMLKENSA